jgi:Protein of unknown function (DUF3822)
MANITFDILDENFFTKTTYQYHLNMVLADDAFTYLVYDDEQLLAYRSYLLEDKNRALFSWKDELQTLIHQDKMLQLSFHSAKFLLLHQKFTFVPTALFDATNASSYLENVSSDFKSDILTYENIESQGFVNVFSVPLDLHQFIKTTFSTATIHHAVGFLAENIVQNEVTLTPTATSRLYVHFHHQQMQVLAIDSDKKVCFANNFIFQTANDIAYYMMLVINQLKLNPETVTVNLSGHIEKNTEAYNAVYRYVVNLQFLDYSIKKAKKRSFENTHNALFANIL